MKYSILCALALLLCSCIHFPHDQDHPPPTPTSQQPVENTAGVWLICGPLHSDFVVETDWLIDSGCKLPPSVKNYKYLCFGWGDRIAYTRRWRSHDITQALFWPSESIVQVVAFNTQVVPTFPNQEVVKVSVPYSGGRPMANFLNSSFVFDPKTPDTPITLRPSKWGHGYFLKSPYAYYLPRMCNQWVSTALNLAGVHTTNPTPTMTAQSLKADLLRYQEQQP